jgi:hypothetical protein
VYNGTFIVFMSCNRFAAAHASGHICIYTRTDTATAANTIDNVKETADELKEYMIKDDIDSSGNSSGLTDVAVDGTTITDTPELQLELLNVSRTVYWFSSVHISVVYLGQSDNINHSVIGGVYICCIFHAIQAAPSQDYMIPVELESASKVIAVLLIVKVKTTVAAVIIQDAYASIAQSYLLIQTYQKYAVHRYLHRTSVR